MRLSSTQPHDFLHTPCTHPHSVCPPRLPHLPLCLVGLLHCRLCLLCQHQLARLEHLLLPQPHGCRGVVCGWVAATTCMRAGQRQHSRNDVRTRAGQQPMSGLIYAGQRHTVTTAAALVGCSQERRGASTRATTMCLWQRPGLLCARCCATPPTRCHHQFCTSQTPSNHHYHHSHHMSHTTHPPVGPWAVCCAGVQTGHWWQTWTLET